MALRPEVFVEDGQWQEYIMVGNGDSYGARMYFYKNWKRWKLQLSYTYARSREWFGELPDNGNPPEEEILSFYSVHWKSNCLPYAGVSFRF